MPFNNFREKANFIWQVADNTVKAHEDGDVTLPFVVLRQAAGGTNFYNQSFFDLRRLVEMFNEVDLSPNNVTNHEMGYIFEELLWRFSDILWLTKML